MQTHTFIADTANEAVARIRAELGPAAVVLSVRKLPRSGLSRLLKSEQIEVIARVPEPQPEFAPEPEPEPQAVEPIDLPNPLQELRDEIRALKQQVASIHLAQKSVQEPPAPTLPTLIPIAPTLSTLATSSPTLATSTPSLVTHSAPTYSVPEPTGQTRPPTFAAPTLTAPPAISSLPDAIDQKPSSGIENFIKAASAAARNEKPVSSLDRILVQTGLLPVFAERILEEVSPFRSQAAPIGEQIQAVKQILRTKWQGSPEAGQFGVHLFVGTPGAGKSTVLCKMLAQTSLLEGQPAAVYQVDTHLANPSPQPAIFTEIVGGRFERTLPGVFERGDESVFIDVPGVPLHDTKGLESLRSVIQCFGAPQVHLVLNAAYEASHLLEQVRFFSKIGITDLAITHLDEETRWGKLWNLVFGTNYNVRFLSSGQNIPGDFLPASADLLLGRQFPGK